MRDYKNYFKTCNRCIVSSGASLPKGDQGGSGMSHLEPGTVLGIKSAKRSGDVFHDVGHYVSYNY